MGKVRKRKVVAEETAEKLNISRSQDSVVKDAQNSNGNSKQETVNKKAKLSKDDKSDRSQSREK